MKSSCGSLGAFELAQKAETIEKIGREGSTEISDQMFRELRDATNEVLSILNAELNN
jgi:HPt (histidine-containing phosphotransfer) domain-containing protein